MGGQANIGYDIEKSKADRAKCCFCKEKIIEEYRMINQYANRHCHIRCAGFTLSRLKEMRSWDDIVQSMAVYDIIEDLVRKK